MSILPRYEDGRICIPWWEVPLIWSWSAVASVLVTVGGAGTVVRSMIGLDISDASIIALFAAAFVASAFVLFVAYYDGFKKQIQDAALIKAKQARGETITIQDEVDLAKVSKFDLRYIIAMTVGIIMSGAVSVVITYALCMVLHVPDEWVYYAAVAFVISIMVSAILDEKFLHKAANGSFRADVTTPLVQKIEADAVEAAKRGDGSADTASMIDAFIEALTKAKMQK